MLHNVTMECKHKNILRLYERDKNWISTMIYKCKDCGELLQKGFETIKPKQLNKEPTLAEQTHDALNVEGEVGK